MKALRYLLLLTCVVVLPACGQKGDLYFPDKTAAADDATVLES